MLFLYAYVYRVVTHENNHAVSLYVVMYALLVGHLHWKMTANTILHLRRPRSVRNTCHVFIIADVNRSAMFAL